MRNLNFLRDKLFFFLKEHASKKIVIVVNSYDRIGEIAEAIKRSLTYALADLTILCFKTKIPEPFRELRHKITVSEDYLSNSDYAKIDDHVFSDVTKNWDRDLLKERPDIFTYHGVELARIVEYDLQLFLLAKIKALLVMDRAIEKENYEAVFIIDSNEELDNFDKLLRQNYHIPAAFIRIENQGASMGAPKKMLSMIASAFVNGASPFVARKTKKSILIDARLFRQLGIKDDRNFLLVPFTGDVKLRLGLLFKRTAYASFNLGAGVLGKSKGSSAIHGFDLRDIEDSFIFEGLAYGTLVKDRIRTIVSEDFVRFRKNIDILTNTVNRFGIKSAILRNDVREMEKTIVFASKKVGVSTLVIQHGILTESNGHGRIFADEIAVWGDYSVRWYRNLGNDPQKTVVTGNPNFDILCAYIGAQVDEKLMRRLNPAAKKYTVTLITTGVGNVRFSSFITDDTTENLIREVAAAISSLGNVNLVIKLHPNERIETFSGLIEKEQREFIRIAEGIDLYDLLKASDLVVTIDSTVGLEALIMGKPLVVVNLGRRKTTIPYVENGVAIGAHKKEEIASAIINALEDDGIRRRALEARDVFVKDFVYRTDGKSKDRVLELIEGRRGKYGR